MVFVWGGEGKTLPASRLPLIAQIIFLVVLKCRLEHLCHLGTILMAAFCRLAWKERSPLTKDKSFCKGQTLCIVRQDITNLVSQFSQIQL